MITAPRRRAKALVALGDALGDDVQIGSDVQLVAPITVGNGETVGAGTTVWKDVEADSLVVNPKKQTADRTWRRPKKT